MKMCKIKLKRNRVQEVINELTYMYENQRIALAIVTIALAITMGIAGYLAFKVAENAIWTNSLTPKCRILLEEMDQRFAEECR